MVYDPGPRASKEEVLFCTGLPDSHRMKKLLEALQRHDHIHGSDDVALTRIAQFLVRRALLTKHEEPTWEGILPVMSALLEKLVEIKGRVEQHREEAPRRHRDKAMGKKY